MLNFSSILVLILTVSDRNRCCSFATLMLCDAFPGKKQGARSMDKHQHLKTSVLPRLQQENELKHAETIVTLLKTCSCAVG